LTPESMAGYGWAHSLKETAHDDYRCHHT
jgi:hypothetical protein